jgi:hypothetical protein
MTFEEFKEDWPYFYIVSSLPILIIMINLLGALGVMLTLVVPMLILVLQRR